jgi:hypothetical protein
MNYEIAEGEKNAVFEESQLGSSIKIAKSLNVSDLAILMEDPQ